MTYQIYAFTSLLGSKYKLDQNIFVFFFFFFFEKENIVVFRKAKL